MSPRPYTHAYTLTACRFAYTRTYAYRLNMSHDSDSDQAVTVTVKTMTGTVYAIEVPPLSECRYRHGYDGCIGHLYAALHPLLCPALPLGVVSLYLEQPRTLEDGTEETDLIPCHGMEFTRPFTDDMVFFAVVSFDALDVLIHRRYATRMMGYESPLVFYSVVITNTVSGYCISRASSLCSFYSIHDPVRNTTVYYPESSIAVQTFAEYRGEPEQTVHRILHSRPSFTSFRECLASMHDPLIDALLDRIVAASFCNVDGAEDEDPASLH